MAGSGPLCGKEPGPTHVPTVTLPGICNAIDLVAMDNFLEMLWSGLSHSRDILGLLPAGWAQQTWDTCQSTFGQEWPGLLSGRDHSRSR